MAGNYADAPNNRLSPDLDGTQCYRSNDLQSISQINGSLPALNNENNGTYGIGLGTSETVYVYWFFPRLMDITHIYTCMWSTNTRYYGMAWSANTTNGIDGTWTTFTYPAGVGYNNLIEIRQNIQSVALSGVRCIRVVQGSVAGNGHWGKVFFYGRPTAGENSDRVEFWHPTLDQRIDPAWFDWGNAQRGSTLDKTFRIKNLSPTLTANNVVMTFDAQFDTSPTNTSQHYLSSDGTNFFATRTITSIGPGAISPVYTMRRVTPTNAVLSLWWMRCRANVTSWT